MSPPARQSRTGLPRLTAGPRVLLVDDHAVVRRGLKEIIQEEMPAAAFGEAGDGREALALVSSGGWDIVVLDITIPGRNGLEVLKEIKEIHPNPPVLVLSVHDEDQYALRTLKAGAAGYLTKETAPDALAAAVKQVLAGGIYVSAGLAERLSGQIRSGTLGPVHQRLSDREYEVLTLMAAGHTVSGIAASLDLSVKTVSTYRTRILKKLGMQTTAELMRYAIREGLVD